MLNDYEGCKANNGCLSFEHFFLNIRLKNEKKTVLTTHNQIITQVRFINITVLKKILCLKNLKIYEIVKKLQCFSISFPEFPSFFKSYLLILLKDLKFSKKENKITSSIIKALQKAHHHNFNFTFRQFFQYIPSNI